MPEIVLKPGREKSILRHHPWIFSGAIAKVTGSPKTGQPVDVISSKGEFLARAAYNSNSNITGRIWTWDIQEQIDPNFLQKRLRIAFDARYQFPQLINSDAMRLVHGESDSLPGLIVDRYGDVIVIQFLAAGVEYWKSEIISIVQKLSGVKSLYERSDLDVRQLENLPLHEGWLAGQESTASLRINENGLMYLVDIIHGHKTGFYLDQRDNRLFARGISNNKDVLDCFCYTGGFSINVLAGNCASVTLVDSSKDALENAKNNIELNKLPLERAKFVEQDVFKYLRTIRDRGETYDMIILDPPKFAPTVSQLERAARGYKDINLLALKILRPGGVLMTFSCSGGVSEDLFQKIVASAALDAGVEAKIIHRLHQAPDHPVSLNFPEGAYLKGFVIQKQV